MPGRTRMYPLGVGGIQTRVLEEGSGESTVLFLHGVGARADRWRENLSACAESGLHAYAVDFPGHGFASKGDGIEYSVSAFADFVAAFLEVVGVSRVTLVGTSLGGHVAAAVAIERPDLVTGLVLVGPMGIEPVGKEAREALAVALTKTSRLGVVNKLRSLVHDPALVTDDWIDEEHRINNSPGADESFAHLGTYFRTSIDDDVVGDALLRQRPDLACLLIWGSQDQMVPVRLAEAVLRDLPQGSTYVEIPKACHAPYMERPDAFNDALLNYIPNVSDAGSRLGEP